MFSKQDTNAWSLLCFVYACFFALFLFAEPALAESFEEGEDLFDMSLSELMDLEIYVPATLTEKDPLKIPASITVITAKDIAVTPARNLLDLIEIYVPGALYLNHSVGPVPGIRGIIADRPYKFLVNLNGININIKAHYGARLELMNWDLNDIERIEIVRGPGAVTYGPGAIGGVINIYTKKSTQAPGFQTGGTFWDKYNSLGQYLSYGRDFGDIDLYSYVSVVHTQGHSPDLFGVSNDTTYGYVGTSGGPYAPNPPANYLADYYSEPQVKGHVDVHFSNDWRFWARYVSASTSLVQHSGIQYDVDGDGDYEDFRQTRYRYYQFALENNTVLNDDLTLKSLYGFSSIDVHNVEKYYSALGTANNRENLQNIKWIWSEYEYFLRYMLNYQPQDDTIKAALGFECSYDTFGPAWGKSANSGFRMADGIISGPDSGAYGSGSNQVDAGNPKYFPVGDGFETFTYAFLGEFNYKLTPKMTTIWSARVDKHSYTDHMFSPRFALIYELDTEEYLKFIAQRSVRMNTSEELYMNHVQTQSNEPEKLDTLELIYSRKFNDRINFQISGFYNRNEAIAWDWNQKRSAPLGELKTLGLELETKYQTEGFNLGINHSFVKQQDWELAEGIDVSGISYSDYYRDVNGDGSVVILSKGNDLNNWSNHATKLYSNIDLYDGKITLHGNAQIFWGFTGNQDGLDALSEAIGGSAAINSIRDHDAYETEIKANVSLTYHINPSSDLTFFVQNIPLLGDNKRYSYSSGYKKSYPDKSSWVEEPTVFGLQYHVRF